MKQNPVDALINKYLYEFTRGMSETDLCRFAHQLGDGLDALFWGGNLGYSLTAKGKAALREQPSKAR